MAIVNGSLQSGYKNSAWFTANPTVVLKEGQIVYLEQTGTYKLGDGVTQLSALTFLGGGGTVDVNTIGAAINGATSASPNDTDLVMSVDTSVAKKNTWTQIKAFLKTYFDTVYATITDLTGYVKKGTLTTNYILKASSTDKATNSSITDDGTDVNFNGDGVNAMVNWLSDATVRGEINTNNANSRWTFESKNGYDIMMLNGTTYVYYSGTNIRLATNNTDVLEITSGQKVNLPLLTASQIVETDSSKNLVSAAKGTAYNKNFGTTSGTVREGDNRTFTDLTISGTAGNGYIDLTNQSSSPSAPSSGIRRLFNDSLGKLSSIMSIGTVSVFRGKIYSDTTTSSALTGSTSNTLIKSGLVKGNTFSTSSTDTIRIESLLLKTGTVGVVTQRYYVNTSNTLSGATLIGTSGGTGVTATFVSMVRNGLIKSTTNTEFFATSTVAQTDEGLNGAGGSGGVTSVNIDWTVDQYIIQAAQNANSGDSTVSSYLKIFRD